MLPYLFLFLFASFLYVKRPQDTSKVQFGLFTLFTILIAGFRDMIGGYDIYIYSEVYEYVDKLSAFDIRYFETGFMYYYKFLFLFDQSREFMIFATSLLMFSLHYWVIGKMTINKNMTMFLYFCKFFLFSFVYLRQGLAMGIVWLSLIYLIEQKRWFYIYPLVIVAFFFHKTSIIIIPFLFAHKIKFTHLQMLAISLILLGITLSPLGNILAELAVESVDKKYGAYTKLTTGVNFFYLAEALMILYLLLLFKKQFYQSTRGIFIFNGMFFYLCVSIVSLTNAAFIRFLWFYLVFLFLFIPFIYDFIKDNKYKANFKLLVFIYFSLVFFRLLFYYDDGDFMPYKAFFEDFDRHGLSEHMEYRNK